MGLLDKTTQQAYYQGSNFGNYQFTSLNDIIKSVLNSNESTLLIVIYNNQNQRRYLGLKLK